MIPAGFLQELLGRIDIVELVGRHVTLKKAGANYMGLCPFHGEKSPSFSVSASKQFYHCFGCGVSGDAIKFLTEHTGASFREAVSDLAGQIGMNVPDEDDNPQARAEAVKRKAKESTLGDVMAKAAASYREQLKASPRAVSYLKQRGLTGHIAARFALGYAPDGWRHLATVFPRYDDPLLAEAGMVITPELQAGQDEADQKRYDRFRDRIMFPIRDITGDCIAFGGRVLDKGEPKYLNSPETPVFTKGRELYGLFEGRKAMRERGYALVVEGYMDVVALAQLGLENAVATLGTACTDDHVRKLMRFTETVVFSFDGDAAGRRAAVRALEAALPHAGDTRSFKFLFLPKEHDPDSYVREHGVEAFESLVVASMPLSKHVVAVASDGCDLGLAEGRAKFAAQAKPLWSALPVGALRAQLLREIATLGQVEPDDLLRLWNASRDGPNHPNASGTRRGERGERGDGGDASPWASHKSPRAQPRKTTPARAPMRGPADSVARLLMLRSTWWDTLSEAERSTLAGCDGWHGEFFRWLDRSSADSGAMPWAAMRMAISEEPWAPSAVALINTTDPAFEPHADDLHRAIGQLFTGVPFKLPNALPGALPHGS
jgi:DNA primase